MLPTLVSSRFMLIKVNFKIHIQKFQQTALKINAEYSLVILKEINIICISTNSFTIYIKSDKILNAEL